MASLTSPLLLLLAKDFSHSIKLFPLLLEFERFHASPKVFALETVLPKDMGFV
jgi:hypothetical protein